MSRSRTLATLAVVTAALGGALAPAAAADPAALVNPLNGTLGPGFPSVGAGLPFGRQLLPAQEAGCPNVKSVSAELGAVCKELSANI